MSLPKALAGVRVVDFTWVRSGPWGMRWLGALGAEVIKIEWPPNIIGRAGGGAASYSPKEIKDTLNGSGFFNDTNANKLATTVNARSEKGLDLVKQLISVSDAVVENFSAGVLEDWGLSYDEMRKVRPDIIYVSMAGFGQTGRHKMYNTMGPVAQALSGMTFLSGQPDMPPAGWGWSYLDDTGGLYAAIATLTGLAHRNATGQGQHADLSQMITGAALNGPAFLDILVNGRKSRRPGYPPGNRAVWPGAELLNNYRGPVTAPHNAYRTKGGGYNDWATIACFSEEEWKALVQVMGAPEWAATGDFSTVRGRLASQEELDKRIEEWTLTLEKYELMERCQAAGVRAMPVQSPQDRVDNDPQLKHRGYLAEMEHPTLGTHGIQTAPFDMSETPAGIWRYGPRVGEDNRQVFEELLGVPHDDLVEGYGDGTFWPGNFSIDNYGYVQDSLNAQPPRSVELPRRTEAGPYPSAARADGHTPRGPLTGLRVLELSGEKGQWLGKMLADLGADVIKIEPPEGEATRKVGPFVDDIPNPDRSLAFWHYNTSKRGITLGIETKDGKRLFRRLAATADVIIETFEPGYLPSLGLGYDDLRGENPGLLMCSMTDFGQTGPWRDYRGCDLVHLAAGGQMGCCGYDEDEWPDAPPIAGGGGQAWHTAGHYGYIALLAALYHRDITGRGQHIDLAVHDALALTTEGMVYSYIYGGDVAHRRTGRHGSPTKTELTQFLCGDGLYINASLGGAGGLSPARLKSFATFLDQHGLADDLLGEKYADVAAIQGSMAHIREVILNAIPNLPRDDIYHNAQQIGLTFGAIRAPDELVDDGHLHDRGFWHEVEHPELGKSIRYPGSGVVYNASPFRISRRAPMLGEHNEEIYCGELGLEKMELTMAAEAGIV